MKDTKHLLFRMTIDWFQCIIERKNLMLHVWTCSCHYNISVGSEFSHLPQQMQPNHWGNQSSGHLRQAFLEKLEDDQFCWSTSWISYNLNVIVYCPATVQLQGNFWASRVFFSEKFMSHIHDMNSWSPASKLVLSWLIRFKCWYRSVNSYQLLQSFHSISLSLHYICYDTLALHIGRHWIENQE